jgi:methylenetetrahydrofolate--tRNA-(uracil-5-)-methyltransferase
MLKEELRRAGSLLIGVAREVAVPAGTALAVDRERFASLVTAKLEAHARIEVLREEAASIPSERVVIVATGPLTSPALAADLSRRAGAAHLYFYDAIAPIVEADSIDYSIAYRAARYGKGGADYLNCPLDRDQYETFLDALLAAESVPLHEFESTSYFEACLPIEELARRGRDTLRYGPMKPVGLPDPRTGKTPWAVVQLRQETIRADSYNMVGFQNHLKFGEQKRVLRMIPALEQAEFLTYGQMHRNTFINGPRLLTDTLQFKADPRILFAGQISGVEGYVEAMATGLMAGMHAAALVNGRTPRPAPRESALGSLAAYVAGADPNNYQPANITFALLPPLAGAAPGGGRNKRQRHELQIAAGLEAMTNWLASYDAVAMRV